MMMKIKKILNRSITVYHYISLKNDESTLLAYCTKMKKSGAGGNARTSVKGGGKSLSHDYLSTLKNFSH
jgi:hypothetical protein